MTVKELKTLLESAPDNLPVFIYLGDTAFMEPGEDSGVSEMGPECDDEGNILPGAKPFEAFLIYPEFEL